MEEADKQAKQEMKAENNGGKHIKHKGFADDSIVQQYVQYAYDIGGMDLVLLIECENGSWNMYQQSNYVKNGKREESYGLCQVLRQSHPEIVNNKLFWDDYKRQLDKCNELMKNGTPFYGRDRNIKGVKCSSYVKDRFLID